MKNKSFIKFLGLFLAFAMGMEARAEVSGTILEGTTGTASATVFVKPRDGFVQITDMSWVLDAGVTTGLVGFRPGNEKKAVTSASAAAGTAVWFSNPTTTVAVADYVIVYVASTQTYYLRRATAVATTSITVGQSITDALTTNDFVWTTTGTFYKAIPNTVSGTAQFYSIWLPRNVPTAVSIEGNTTACRIQINGVRSTDK